MSSIPSADAGTGTNPLLFERQSSLMNVTRPRKTSIATLLAVLSLCAATQAVAPAGAGATINQGDGSLLCASIGASWSARYGTCVVPDGVGGWIVVSEFVNIRDVKAPEPECDNLTCPLQQIGEQGSKPSSGEVGKGDPNARGAVKPTKPAAIKPKGKQEPLSKARCAAILKTVKIKTIAIESLVAQLYYYRYGPGEVFVLEHAANLAGRKEKAEMVRATEADKYRRGNCEAKTGPLPE